MNIAYSNLSYYEHESEIKGEMYQLQMFLKLVYSS